MISSVAIFIMMVECTIMANMRHFHLNYDKNQNYTEVKIESERLYYLNLRLRRCYINLRNNLWRRGNNLNLVVQEPASIILSLNQVRIFE